MAVDIPTLDELAEVTGQDKKQLIKDTKAAANPRAGTSRGESVTAED